MVLDGFRFDLGGFRSFHVSVATTDYVKIMRHIL